MYINSFDKSSDPTADKLSKLMDLTTQTSQANDSMLREIQEANDYIRISNPAEFTELIQNGIAIFTSLLKQYDDITIILANYKSDLNDHVSDE